MAEQERPKDLDENADGTVTTRAAIRNAILNADYAKVLEGRSEKEISRHFSVFTPSLCLICVDENGDAEEAPCETVRILRGEG